MASRIGLGVAAAVMGYGALYVAGRRMGSTTAEHARQLPGDDVVAHSTVVTDHAVTIAAPPQAVWPWLTQVGWHLGGYYTPHWVDALLFRANWASLDRLDPTLVRDLAVGDVIPDGPPGTAWYAVTTVDRPRALVLRSTTHVPPGWRERFGAGIDLTWTFHLTPAPGGGTRLHVRARGRTWPWWLTAGYHAALVPADCIMAVGMLRGIKRRAEAAAPPQLSGRQPYAPPPAEDASVATSARPARAAEDEPMTGPGGADRPWRRQVGQVLAAVPLFLAAPLLRPWHTRWGATDAEVAAPMPGDELVPGCQYRTTRAITIAAAPRQVWPWLVQVGMGRAGFYSLDLLDNLGRPSADAVLPQYQRLAVGQWVPMSPTPSDRTAFTVHSVEPERLLVWAKPDSTWVWQLTATANGSTRLVTRVRTRYQWRRPASALLSVLLMELGDFAMLRAMLRGIRSRAERLAREARATGVPVS